MKSYFAHSLILSLLYLHVPFLTLSSTTAINTPVKNIQKEQPPIGSAMCATPSMHGIPIQHRPQSDKTRLRKSRSEKEVRIQRRHTPMHTPFHAQPLLPLQHITPAILFARSPVEGIGFSILKHQSKRSSNGKNTKKILLQQNAVIATKNAIHASR